MCKSLCTFVSLREDIYRGTKILHVFIVTSQNKTITWETNQDISCVMQDASDVVSGQAILSAVLHLSLATFWKAWNSLKWLKRTTPGKKNNVFSWQSFLYTLEICETNFSVTRHSIITWFWVQFGVKKHKQIFQT